MALDWVPTRWGSFFKALGEMVCVWTGLKQAVSTEDRGEAAKEVIDEAMSRNNLSSHLPCFALLKVWCGLWTVLVKSLVYSICQIF